MRWAIAIAVAVSASVAATLAQNPPPSQEQRPTFRRGTNLVLVDAYPRRDGKVVEGLKPADFEVLEDGKPQSIDQFEFVRIEPVPEDERIDPKTQAEMIELAGDPHNRVFVVLLDSYHVSRNDSERAKWPLVNMLNRVIGRGDLVGVTTPQFPPSSMVLGRKLVSVEEQLSATWGVRGDLARASEEEQLFDNCFISDPRTGRDFRVSDDGAGRSLSNILVDRWREDKTLQHLKGLITRMGELREARTIVMAVTGGWRLFKEDHTLANQIGRMGGGPPPVGVPPGGGPIGILSRNGNGPTNSKCTSEALRLAYLDNERVFMEIVSLANRNNIVFYPLSPGGLVASDAAPHEFVGGGLEGLMADMDHARARGDAALALAHETDGIAIFNQNDFRSGLQRIINDVSAYYLLGYYSTNQTADGKLRRIKVQVKQQNVQVTARRGYVVPTAAAVEKKEAAKAAMPAAPLAPAEVTEALKTLSRIGVNDGLLLTAAVTGADMNVVAELSSGAIELGKWKDGGGVIVTVTGANGAIAGTGNGAIEAGGRSALVRVPIAAGSGPWRATAKVTGRDGTIDVAVDVPDAASRVLGSPIVFRGAGTGRAVLKPAAEMLFHRTERVHIELPIAGTLDQREARLLDIRGRLIPSAPTLTEREEDGRMILAVDLSLAPLSGGDFVIEVSGARGTETDKKYLGLRVVR